MLNKKIMLLVLVMVSATAGFTQSNKTTVQDKNITDFSGKWELVEANGMKMSADPSAPSRQIILNIKSDNSRITIERVNQKTSETAQFIFYSDGRGESNPTSAFGYASSRKSPFMYTSNTSADYKSKTILKDGKLITDFESTISFIGTKTVFLTNTDRWQLASKGEKLIFTSSSVRQNSDIPKVSADLNDNPIEMNVVKYVFKRIS